jgi:putative flippase GtrA
MSGLIRQSLRFGAVGVVNTVIGLLAIYAVIFFFNTGPATANAVGYALGLAVSFALNRIWTFGDGRAIGKVLPGYLLAAAISYLLNLSVVLLCTHYFGVGPYLVQFFGIGIYTVTLFLGCRWFVFQESSLGEVSLKPHLSGCELHNATKGNLGLQSKVLNPFFVLILVGIMPILIAMSFMHLWQWDLSIPLVYNENGGDDTWQLILTKMLVDTGWVLNNPFLGAPDVSHWHNNAAAQTSALHSILMLGLSKLLHDPIEVQQVYYLLNFALISLTSFFSCRLLGLARLPAFCISILFSLLGYRFNFIIYAFLSNYFTVPLALAAVFWIMTGEFSRFFSSDAKATKIALKEVLSSSKFVLGLFFIALIAISDGYYAFFTLLLLGFSTFVRALSGDIKKPASLLVPAIYMATLITIALIVAWPLGAYKHSHPEEFAPNGVQDPALIKHSYEAEIYSSSLKLLIAPSSNHRIESLANLGQKILKTSEEARQFKIGAPNVNLGTFGSILFIIALILLIVPTLGRVASSNFLSNDATPEDKLISAAIVLALFIFLCSISGGIGTLIALVYPDIRAYDRFPLFLIFVLYIGAGAAATTALSKAQGKEWWGLVSLIVLITILSLYDQVPRSVPKGSTEIKSRFLAEKNFVKRIEAKLPPGAMVYQYPYSQWLSNSDYYGWGAFGQERLYLHSATLRWSNGASKNSPVDDWHARLSRIPIDQLLTEVQAAGFSAVVVDRVVVSPAENVRVSKALMEHTSVAPIEDEASRLAFFRLNDPGYRLVYDKSFKDVEKIVISERLRMLTSTLPRLVNPTALKNLLENNNGKGALVIERVAHPEVFFSAAQLDRGNGEKPISPLSDMQGEFRCVIASSTPVDAGNDILVLTIANNSDFDWKFNQGNFPLQVGVHLRSLDGTLLRFDDGLRLSTGTPGYVTGKITQSEPLSIPRGTEGQIRFPLSKIDLKGIGKDHQDLVADFRMVQDGHAWFEHLGCKVIIKN